MSFKILISISYLSSYIQKLRNGKGTCFWSCKWLGGSPLKNYFPRLFALEMNKNCLVRDRSQVYTPLTSTYVVASQLNITSNHSTLFGCSQPPIVGSLHLVGLMGSLPRQSVGPIRSMRYVLGSIQHSIGPTHSFVHATQPNGVVYARAWRNDTNDTDEWSCLIHESRTFSAKGMKDLII